MKATFFSTTDNTSIICELNYFFRVYIRFKKNLTYKRKMSCPNQLYAAENDS